MKPSHPSWVKDFQLQVTIATLRRLNTGTILWELATSGTVDQKFS